MSAFLMRWGQAVSVAVALAAMACDRPVQSTPPVPPGEVTAEARALIPIDGANVGPDPDCFGNADCNDNNPCTTDACVSGVCRWTNNTNSCSDGNACTSGDTCSSGSCRGGIQTLCFAPSGPCLSSSCNPSTGQCEEKPVTNGTVCNDGNACTNDTVCTNGQCGGGTAVTCTPTNQCYTASCDSATGCVQTVKTGQTCNDGMACTYGEKCDSNGSCGGGTAVTCTSDQCNTKACNGTATCTVTPKTGTACNDNDLCTYGEKCDSAGACGSGTRVTCTSDTCNTRTCNGSSSCTVAAKTGTRCDDTNLCTFDDACGSDGKCAGTALTCTSDNAADRTCNGTSTCTVTPRPGAACDDNNPCTAGDVRQTDGSCKGTPYTCALNECLTASVCDGKGGCTSTAKPDGTECDADKSKCTPKDTCRAGVCVKDPAPVSCVAKDCNTVTCNAETGACEYKPSSGGSCGVTGCYTQGTCNNGVCSGTPKDCSSLDGPCATGVCDAATGACVAAPKANGLPCSVGGKCLGAAACAFGVCMPTAATCPASSSACKVATCDPETGQCREVNRAAGTACDPQNSCMSDATCDDKGACVGTPSPIGQPCTTSTGAVGSCIANTCIANVTDPMKPNPGTDAKDAGTPSDAPAGTGGSGGQPTNPMTKSGSGGCTVGGEGAGFGWLSGLLALWVLGRRRRR